MKYCEISQYFIIKNKELYSYFNIKHKKTEYI